MSRRRAGRLRVVGALLAAFVIVLLSAFGPSYYKPQADQAAFECDRKANQSSSIRWQILPYPGWDCTFDLPDGASRTSYLGYWL